MKHSRLFVFNTIIAAFAFPVLGQLAFFSDQIQVWLFVVMALLLLVVEAVAYFARYIHTGHAVAVLLRDTLFAISWVSVYIWLPDSAMGVAYSVLSVPLIFSLRMLLGFGNDTIVSTQTILTAAGLSALPFALQQYFSFSSGVLTLIVFVWTLGLAFATFSFTPQTFRQRSLQTLVVAFLSTEIYVTLLFLPFHFTAQAILLLLGFYWLWVLSFQHLAGALNVRKVQFYTALTAILAFLTIFSTPWKPI